MAHISINELSEELNTTPRTARKFLRSVTPVEDQPGKGGRWQIEKRALRSLKKQFATFEKEHMRTEDEALEPHELGQEELPETIES